METGDGRYRVYAAVAHDGSPCYRLFRVETKMGRELAEYPEGEYATLDELVRDAPFDLADLAGVED